MSNTNFTQRGVAAFIQFLQDGLRLASDGTRLRARDATDAAFVEIEGAQATSDDALVTLAQVGGLAAQYRTVAIDFNSNGEVNIGAALPANAVVIDAFVNIDSPFDNDAPDVSVGTSGLPTTVMEAAEIDAASAGSYESGAEYLPASALQLVADVTPGGTPSASGTGHVVVQYLVVP